MSPAITAPDTWTLAGRTFNSRLLVGTGKYADNAVARAAIDESAAEIVTVAVRRVDFSAAENVLSALDRSRHTLFCCAALHHG
jgi:thiazole synthase ThiGH ThiG subunit